jgi:hypothetical protein
MVMRQSWRGRESDMDKLRSLRSWRLGKWRLWWGEVLPFRAIASPIAWHSRHHAHDWRSFRVLKIQELFADFSCVLPGAAESSEHRTQALYHVLQHPPSLRVMNYWVGSKSTETCRQSTQVPQFSTSSAELNAVFGTLIIRGIWGILLGLYAY